MVASTPSLAAQLGQQASQAATIDQAVVYDVNPLTITYHAGQVGAQCVSSYIPVLNDTVQIAIQGNSYLILGKVQSQQPQSGGFILIPPTSPWTIRAGGIPLYCCLAAPGLVILNGEVVPNGAGNGSQCGQMPAGMYSTKYNISAAAGNAGVAASASSVCVVDTAGAIRIYNNGGFSTVGQQINMYLLVGAP